MIYFRADANHNIGMGHIMRCLSIADAVANIFDNDIIFLLADDNAHQFILDRGYEAIILHSSYDDMEAELNYWPRITPNIIIVDSYYATPKYMGVLREKVGKGGLVYVDDLAIFPYPVDIIVNYNAYAKLSLYTKIYADSEMPIMVLGPNYAPLRSMFRGIEKKKQPKNVKNVLISTGGSDELHLALAMVKYICGMPGKNEAKYFHFLLGAMNTDKEEIRSLANAQPNIFLHENVSDMKSLISSCDIAVSAAGSTLYEICACGVPLITYSIADNQISGAEAFGQSGLAQNIGDLRNPVTIETSLVMSGELDSSSVERIFSAVLELSDNYKKRCEVGTRMQDMIDGFGADRIAEVIFKSLPASVF